MGDRCVRDEIEKAIEKPETCPENGNENDGAGYAFPAGDLQWGLAWHHHSLHIRRDGGHHQRSDAPHSLAKLMARAIRIAETGQLGGDQRVVDVMEHVSPWAKGCVSHQQAPRQARGRFP